MKRPPRPDDAKAWATVARTVTPASGRAVPDLPDEPKPPEPPPAATAPLIVPPLPKPKSPRPPRYEPEVIEPKRKRRIATERLPIEAKIDLHGLTLFQAEDRVKAFVRHSYALGFRAVLIVTGKGSSGGGVIRDWAPTWLADGLLAGMVAGVSTAERRHGGDGALYVALKRRPD